MYDEVIYLLTTQNVTNEVGDQIEQQEKTMRFAKLKSIGQTEFYQAQANGLKPELKFVLADFLEYEGQEEGTFYFNKFYKQLAVAYGLGLRLDLDYLILRFDGGMKAVNPMKAGQDKYPILQPNFRRDFAFHFAVGYPF